MINVWLIGIISFFDHISTEMIYPIIPIYLVARFGATPSLVGTIEGIAENISSVLKVISGYITDKYKKRKKVVMLGYAVGVIYKIVLVASTSWSGVLVARIIDRLAKGIRTPPRDAMISESIEKSNMGKAFGINKTLDFAGASIGIMISYVLLKKVKEVKEYINIFYVSILPSLIVMILLLLIKENQRRKTIKDFLKEVKKLDEELKVFMIASFIFYLGNSSKTFLLLKAKNVGYTTTSMIILYLIYNIVASILATFFGKLSDRIQKKKIIIFSYIVFSFCYILAALAQTKTLIIFVFIIYGIYTAMLEGVEKAYITEKAPIDLKGTALGFHSMLTGIALLPASIIAGNLWDWYGPRMTFVFGASISIISIFVVCKKRKIER